MCLLDLLHGRALARFTALAERKPRQYQKARFEKKTRAADLLAQPRRVSTTGKKAGVINFSNRSFAMQDLMWVAVGIAFFALSIGYVEFCDRVK